MKQSLVRAARRLVLQLGRRHLRRITVDSTDHARTGRHLGASVRPGYCVDDVQALDAPHYVARGSVQGHTYIDGTGRYTRLVWADLMIERAGWR